MIYGLALFALLGSSAAFSADELKATVKTHHRSPFKAQQLAAAAIPQPAQAQAQAQVAQTQTQIQIQNLRTSSVGQVSVESKKPKDKPNFLTDSFFTDARCTQRVYQYGILLDNCVNEVDASGEHRSWKPYLVKNKRARDSYFIDGFEGDDCVGTPSVTIPYASTVDDSYSESIDYYQCRWNAEESVYVKLEESPLKKYIDYKNGWLSTTSDADECSTNLKRPNYYEFTWLKQLEEDYPIPGCLNVESGASIYFHECDKGTVYYDIYYRPDCAGSVDEPDNVLGDGFCYPPEADEEGWTDVGASQSLFCLS